MQKVRTDEAEGLVLVHDITQIVKDEFKGARFRKGHIVTKEDIPILLSLGKEQLYVWDDDVNLLHENDAAEILYEICTGGSDKFTASEIKEGKIEVLADIDGVLKIDLEALLALNSIGEMMIATVHSDFPVKMGDHLAGTRVIPLMIANEKMEKAKKAVGTKPILNILPYQPKKIGIITTGNEVYKGRIKDTFTPVLKQKFKQYPNNEVVCHRVLPDDPDLITSTILEFIEQGIDLVVCTGGMSVDPDDQTPLAIKNTGASIVTYGAPVLPGAMFLLAYATEKKIPIVGLPGCVMYARTTIFDLVLPRLLTDDYMKLADFAKLGHGGLCLNCDVCTFPKCTFGRN